MLAGYIIYKVPRVCQQLCLFVLFFYSFVVRRLSHCGTFDYTYCRSRSGLVVLFVIFPWPPGMVRTLPSISLKLFWDWPVPDLQICFGFHLLVNTSRCSRQHLSVISSKHCLCLQLGLRPTGTPVRLKNPDYLGLKTQTLPDHRVSKMSGLRWVVGALYGYIQNLGYVFHTGTARGQKNRTYASQ